MRPEVDPEENTVLWYYNNIRKPIEQYILRIENATSKLSVCQQLIEAPWTTHLECLDRLSMIKSRADLENNKLIQLYKESVEQFKTTQKQLDDQTRMILGVTMKNGARLYAAQLTLVKTHLKSRAELLADFGIKRHIYQIQTRCFKFAKDYNRVIYSTATCNALYIRIKKLRIFLAENPDEAQFLTAAIFPDKPKELLYNERVFEFSRENVTNHEEAQKAAALKAKADHTKKVEELRREVVPDNHDENSNDSEDSTTNMDEITNMTGSLEVKDEVKNNVENKEESLEDLIH